MVQLSGTAQATTNGSVTQPTVTSPTPTVVPQTALATAGAPNQLAMTNGNIVMVRNATDVRNIINIKSKKKNKAVTFVRLNLQLYYNFNTLTKLLESM